MKFENLDRAKEIREEIIGTTRNIDTLKTEIAKEKISGLRLSEHDDHSGWNLTTVYYKGNHPEKLNKKILEGALEAYEEHLELLMVELAEL